MFLWYERAGCTDACARTVAVNTLVFFEIFYLFSARFFTRSVFSKGGLSGNPYVLYASGALVLLQLVFTYLPFMQKVFDTAPLDLKQWMMIIGVSSSVLFFVEIEKAVCRRFRRGEGFVP